MKGIAHFAAGVAWASACRAAVQAGAAGDPIYFLLGGICGLLPDTIDFKFSRFLYRHDVLVAPDPLRPDPAMIAGAVAETITRAWETGEPVSLKLETMRLASDHWRRYTVRFDTASRQVEVEIGPVVSTGQQLVSRGHGETAVSARAPVPCGIRLDYFAEIEVDILDGPHFRMLRDGDGVRPEFIPWHRSWSHGMVVSIVLGVAGWCLRDISAGVVMAGAHALHWLVDQAGYLGSNMLFPFKRRRAPGRKWTHSGDSTVNAGIVWFCCLFTFWNLYLRSGMAMVPFSFMKIMAWGFLLPVGLAIMAFRLLRRLRSSLESRREND